MKLIHSLFSLSLLLALSGLFCTTACQDDAEPTRAAWLISTDSLIHAAEVYDGKAFEHVVSTTAAGLRVSEPRRVVPMLPRQLHVEMEGKTLFRGTTFRRCRLIPFMWWPSATRSTDKKKATHSSMLISMRFSSSPLALLLDSSG